MDRSYFNILDSIDPLFHSYVTSRIDAIRSESGAEDVTIDHLNEFDQRDILRKYCGSLHSEYSTLQKLMLDNMEVCSRSVRLKPFIR